MKRRELKPAHIAEKYHIVELGCDMCGKRHGGDDDDRKMDLWRDGSFSKRPELAVYEYGPDGYTDVTSVDLCPDCCEWLIDSVRSGSVRRGGK